VPPTLEAVASNEFVAEMLAVKEGVSLSTSLMSSCPELVRASEEIDSKGWEDVSFVVAILDPVTTTSSMISSETSSALNVMGRTAMLSARVVASTDRGIL
jgi:hypothetical protein